MKNLPLFLSERLLNKTRLGIFVSVIALSFSLIGKLNAQSVTFSQLNFKFDGTAISNNSDWGAVDLTFTGSSGVQYLNLTVGSNWVIQNTPVLSLNGVAVSQTQRFWFPIGPDGIPVPTLTYAFTLTGVLGVQPVGATPATVAQDSVQIDFGATFGGPPAGGINKPAPAVNQVGGAPVQPPANHQNFPNQEAGKNECVPVGVSNSLQFLNAKHGLGMPAADISINSLKPGTNWQGPNFGCPLNWYITKANYIKNKKLPITTRVFPAKSIKDMGKEIAAGQDVEMCILWKGGNGGHCVCVTGWVDLGGGKYQITITHDKVQGKAGGTVSENATYDSNTGVWTGALANGTPNFYFVVECPAKAVQQPNKNVPGGMNMKMQGNVGSYPSGVQIQNLNLSGYTNTPPPALSGSGTLTLSCPASIEVSFNGGVSFQPYTCTANASVSIHHTSDAGSTEYYDTEMLSLSLTGLPSGVMIRESPTLQSTGLTIIKPSAGGYQIQSFFDIFTELSLDGGVTWQPEANSNSNTSTMIETDDLTTAAVPTLSQWGLIACSILLLGAGIFFIRRRLLL